ncbi:MAG: CAP domain-containing protein [Actinobacteria bacterium]|nr:CAP domain-containing protein [Actinomycetota bacterium]
MSSYARPSIRSRLFAPLAVVVALAGGLLALSSPGTAVTDDEAVLAGLVNGARSSVGLPPLSLSGALSDVARSHSASMAASGTLSHSGNTATAVGSVVSDWTSVAENVGVGGSVAEVHSALMGSSVHRANILGDFTVLGVGVVRGGDGRVWVTELFAKSATAVTEPVVVEPTTTTTTTTTTPVIETVEAWKAASISPTPVATKAAKARPAARTKTATVRPAARVQRAARPAPVADEESCLPEQAQPQGQGHAYGRCDDVPRSQSPPRRRPPLTPPRDTAVPL